MRCGLERESGNAVERFLASSVTGPFAASESEVPELEKMLKGDLDIGLNENCVNGGASSRGVLGPQTLMPATEWENFCAE